MTVMYWSNLQRAHLVHLVKQEIWTGHKLGLYTLRDAQNAVAILYGMYFIQDLQ